MIELLQRFRTDLEYYCKACLKIRDKQAKLRYLEFNEAQRLVHADISAQRRAEGRVRAVILKARQEGVSTYTASRFFRRIHLWPHTTSVVVADSLDRAGILYDIYDRFYENLPEELMPERKQVTRRHRLAFVNGSELVVRPASDTEAGRAMTIHQLHASEIAFWGADAFDTWMSLMQAVPHEGSEVIVESTAKGAGGFFHEMWEQAESRQGPWLPIFLPWWIHGEYSLPWVDAETECLIMDSPDDFERQALTEGISYRGQMHKLDLGKLAWRRAVIVERFGGDKEKLGKDATRAFMQEFPATAEEAFLVSGSCFFDEDELRRLARLTVEVEKKNRGRMVDDSGHVFLEPNERGFVSIWEHPVPEGHYVIGADTAEGKLVAARRISDTSLEKGGRDFSTAVVYDPVRHKVVAEIHGRIAPEVFAQQLALLGRYYRCSSDVALIGVERSHSSGQTVLRLLREHHRYPRLFWQREFNRRTRRLTNVLGWSTTVETRMPMLDELAYLVRKGDIEIPSKDIIREMITFVIWEDGKPAAEEGCHDDRVIALAIAVQMGREHRHAYPNTTPGWTPEDTLTGM